jgi:hypothetical protein
LNLADADFSCTNVFNSSFCCQPHLLLGKDVSSHRDKYEDVVQNDLAELIVDFNIYILKDGNARWQSV